MLVCCENLERDPEAWMGFCLFSHLLEFIIVAGGKYILCYKEKKENVKLYTIVSYLVAR